MESVARASRFFLQVVLALVLGLGPAGAQILAQLLHAPLCACAGCDRADATESCCAAPQEETEGPVIEDRESACPCALVCPIDAGAAAAARRAPDSRSEIRSELARVQRLVVVAESSLGGASAGDCVRPPRAGADPGPPGARRAHGAARASALGAFLV